MDSMTDDPDLRMPASRGDIHRLRNDLAQRFTAIDARITGLAVDVATLKAETRPIVEPREVVRAVAEINGLRDDVKEVKTTAEATSKRVWMSTGAVAAVVVIINFVAPLVIE